MGLKQNHQGLLFFPLLKCTNFNGFCSCRKHLHLHTPSLPSTPPPEGDASADPHCISNQSKTRNTEPWTAQPAWLALIGNRISSQSLQYSTAAMALTTTTASTLSWPSAPYKRRLCSLSFHTQGKRAIIKSSKYVTWHFALIILE